MGAGTLLGRYAKDTFKQLLRIENPSGLDATERVIEDGEGTTSPLSLSTTAFSNSVAYTSTLATGTAPFTIASTTVVPNLNVDQVDGYDLDQAVTSGASPTFTGTNITAVASITAADESADTTCFPAFVTDATGTVAIKTGSNLTFNSSTGLLSATTLAGANTNWDAAYSHVSNDGSDHSFIDQSVISGSTPTFTATNITGVPAASILAGTFGTGSYTIDTDLTVQTGLNVGTASGATAGQIKCSDMLYVGGTYMYQGTDGGTESRFLMYSDEAGKYLQLTAKGSESIIAALGSQPLSISAGTTMYLDAPTHMYYTIGGTFTWRDNDDSNASRMTLNSATGNLWIDGNLQVGSDIGIAADTDLMQLAVNQLTVNGDVDMSGGDNKLFLGTIGKVQTANASGIIHLYDNNAVLSGYMKLTAGSMQVYSTAAGTISIGDGSGGDIGINTAAAKEINCLTTTFLIRNRADFATKFLLDAVTGSLTLAGYTAIHIPFFGTGGLLEAEDWFAVDNTLKQLELNYDGLTDYNPLTLTNSKAAATANEVVAVWRLKLDDTSLKKAFQIMASFNPTAVVTAKSIVNIKTVEDGNIGNALSFAGYTVRAEQDLIVGNDGSPFLYMDKAAGGVGTFAFTRNVTNVDWTLTHDADENLTLQGLNSDTDFTININDGGVQKDVFKIDSSEASVTLSNSYFRAAGFHKAIVTKTAAYTATLFDDIIICDATGGAFSITLPVAATASGKVYHIKKIDVSANAVTIDGDGAETIDDSATLILTSQYDAAQIVCDGSEWWII